MLSEKMYKFCALDRIFNFQMSKLVFFSDFEGKFQTKQNPEFFRIFAIIQNNFIFNHFLGNISSAFCK